MDLKLRKAGKRRLVEGWRTPKALVPTAAQATASLGDTERGGDDQADRQAGARSGTLQATGALQVIMEHVEG